MEAKRPKGKPVMPAAVAAGKPVKTDKLRAVRLEISEEEHAILRVEAAKQDKSLSELARIAVREYLAKRKGGAK
jgi:predicted HicB family RNase H-like nuclease